MSRAARILVLGKSFPFRRELIEHREIETRWAQTARDVACHLRESRVNAAVISPGYRDVDVIWLLRQTLGRAPCIVLVADEYERSRWRGEPSDVVVLIEEVDSFALLLAHHTGLRLARYPRADVCMPVRVLVGDRELRLQTLDLSLSGIALMGFPDVPEGTLTDLALEIDGREFFAQGRVVRWFDHEDRPAVGLTFMDLAEGPRQAIGAKVEELLSYLPDQEQVQELFGDLNLFESQTLGELRTRDFASALQSFQPATQDLELPALRAALEGTTKVPVWLASFARELTPIEQCAARGEPCPEWCFDVLKTRLSLARARAQAPQHTPPSSLLDEGYRLFTRLKRQTGGKNGVLTSQVRKIRAALLRDLTFSPRLAEPNLDGSAVSDRARGTGQV